MGTVFRERTTGREGGSPAAWLALRVLWAMLAVCASARGNMAGLVKDPSIDGQILPKQETVVEVVAETLEIRFEHGHFSRKPSHSDGRGIAPRAFVTARYEIRNPSRNRVELDLAFPMVAGDLWHEDRLARLSQPAGPREAPFAILLNDKLLPFDPVTSEALIARELPAWRAAIVAWMKRDSFIAELLQKQETTQKDRAALKEYLTNRKGFTPRQAMDFANYLHVGGKPCLPDRWDYGYVCYLFHFLNPDAQTCIAALFRNWRVDFRAIDPHSGKLYEPGGGPEPWLGRGLEWRFSFATFRVALGPGATARLQVSYNHLINGDRVLMGGGEDVRYQFQYILRTAELWKKFGSIDIRVLVPEHLRAAFSLPLEYKGLADGVLAFEGRVNGPRTNLLIGLAPSLRNADFDSPFLDLHRRIGWLRRYGEDRAGPWADDYLLEYAMSLETLRRSGSFDTLVKLKEGADVATEEEWAFLVSKTPVEVYRMIAEKFHDTNGGHRAALMLLELKYREATFDATTFEAVEADARRFTAERPSGCMTPNAWFLLALCRMRHDLKAAAEAFRLAASPRAQWFVREQAEWFADLLRGATDGDAPFLKEWAECEIRNGFGLDYMRRDRLTGRYIFPVNQSHGLAEYWRVYCAHADRPVACALLKRLGLDMDPSRHSQAKRERREALAALYERAAREQIDVPSLRGVRRQALERLGDIGVGHAVGPVLDALGSSDREVRRLAVCILHSAEDKAWARATLARIAGGADAELAMEATFQLAEMGESSAVPHLVKLLRSPDRRVADRAGGLLRKITREPFDHLYSAASAGAREKIIEGWERWWDYRRPRQPL